MKKGLIISIVWLVFFLVLSGSIIYFNEMFWLNLTTAFGWLLLALQTTANYSEKVYLLLKRVWFRLTNPTCIWNLQSEFNGNFNSNTLEILDNELRQINKESYRIIKISNVRRLYKLHTINIEVVLEKENLLRIYIHDHKVSYRDSIDTIDNQLSRIFEIIQYVAKADSGEYGMQITFGKYNPYFGFFIRRLNDKEIQHCNISLKINDKNVYVSKNSIEIISKSYHELNKLSKSYLTLTNPQ